MSDINELLPDLKLRFNINHPSLEECYLFGYECALAGVNEEENPHAKDTEEYYQWADGWWDGFYGEKPLFCFEEEKLEDKGIVAPTMSKAANDKDYNASSGGYLYVILKITSALAATAIVGYQVLDLVA